MLDRDTLTVAMSPGHRRVAGEEDACSIGDSIMKHGMDEWGQPGRQPGPLGTPKFCCPVKGSPASQYGPITKATYSLSYITMFTVEPAYSW